MYPIAMRSVMTKRNVAEKTYIVQLAVVYVLFEFGDEVSQLRSCVKIDIRLSLYRATVSL